MNRGILLCIAVVLCMLQAIDASLKKTDITALLKSHNAARKASGHKMPAIKWSSKLQKVAQAWTNTCPNGDISQSYGKSHYGHVVGSNWAWGFASPYAAANSGWYLGEKPKYKGQKIASGNFEGYGHYTQMVWKGTKYVGCGQTKCHGSYIVDCAYYPPGNYLGCTPWSCGGSGKKREIDEVDVEEDELHLDDDESIMFDYEFMHIARDDGCVPNATCSDEQATCGSIDTGCGDEENCGDNNSAACPDSTTTCSENDCVPVTPCTPTDSCSAKGLTCGSLHDGCGVVTCGTCDTDDFCFRGQCVAQTAVCTGDGFNTTQVNGKCVCASGFIASGGACVPRTGQYDPAQISSYTGDVTGWTSTPAETDDTDNITANALEYTGTGSSVIFWKGNDGNYVSDCATGVQALSRCRIARSRKMSVSALFEPTAATTQYGIVFNVHDAKNYNYVVVKNGQVYFGALYKGKTKEFSLGAHTVETEDVAPEELRVWNVGTTYHVTYNDGNYVAGPNFFKHTTITPDGTVGILAEGPIVVSELNYNNAINIKVPIKVKTTTDCTNQAIGVRKPLFIKKGGIRTTNCVTPTKRDLTVPYVEVEAAGDFFNDPELYQSALQAQIDATSSIAATDGLVDYTDTSIDSSDAFVDLDDDTVVEEYELTPDEIAEADAADAAADAADGAAGADAGLTAGDIAGIVVGSVAGVGAVGGAAVVVKKKGLLTRRKQPKQNDLMASAATPAKPKGAGANVFDFDPNNHSSITGRSQASHV